MKQASSPGSTKVRNMVADPFYQPTMTLTRGLQSLQVTLASEVGLSSYESKSTNKAKGVTIVMGAFREASATIVMGASREATATIVMGLPETNQLGAFQRIRMLSVPARRYL